MGKRSRKRATGPVSAPEAPPAPAPPRRRSRSRIDRFIERAEERPKPPWHPFPLVELSVLAGIVFIVIGFATSGDDRPAFLFGGLALVSVAALELSIREHFAGYRSHTSLLSAVAALAVVIPLWFTPVPQEALLAVALLVGAGAFRALRQAFARRARGLTFRA